MSQNFSEILLEHKGKIIDKWNSYLPIYDEILAPYRESPISLLEIGVQNGGSLEVWSKYFRFAKNIVGCDVDKNCSKLAFADDRIKVFIGDANSLQIKSEIKQISSVFDVIIDDGSHKSPDVIDAFCNYFPLLNEGGVYVVEDIHTSYWSNYGGGLRKNTSSIEFFKKLVDVINAEHWRRDSAENQFLGSYLGIAQSEISSDVIQQIHKVTFVNSMCYIEKRNRADNLLGIRISVGDEAPVTVNSRARNGQHMDPIIMSYRPNLYRRIRLRFHK